MYSTILDENCALIDRHVKIAQQCTDSCLIEQKLT